MRRTSVKLYVIAAWTVLLPRLAVAATESGASGEGGEHASGSSAPPIWPDFVSAVLYLLMFLALLVILGKFVWPKILEGLQGREEKIRHDLAEAEQANKRAQQTLDEYKQKLSEAHGEARKLVDQARNDADQLKQRLQQETQEEMQRQRERAQQEISQARQQAIEDLNAHAAELATAVAGKILQREISDQDTQRLVEQSLEELKNAKLS